MKRRPEALSISEISIFKNCPREWFFSYVLKLEAPSRGDARAVGTIAHHALEVLYSTEGDLSRAQDTVMNDIQKSLMTENPISEAAIKMLPELLIEYYHYAKELQDFQRWEVVEAEKFHQVYIPKIDITFRARFDLVLRIDGKLWILDHKTTKQFATSFLELDEQSTAYMWLGRKVFKEPIAGVIYNQLKKVQPQDTPINSNGMVTRDLSKLSRVSPWRYENALKGDGLMEDKKYLRTLEKKKQPLAHPFFRREFLSRNEQELETFESFLPVIIERMRDASEVTSAYPAPTFLCSWCDYLSLCKMLNEGASVDEVKEAARQLSFKIHQRR